MKKFLGLVVILIILVLGSYYVTGMMTERTLRKNVLAINQSNGLYVEIDKYHRGWFTSKADFKWQAVVPERVVNENGVQKTIPAQTYTLDMPLTVYHGPVIFANSRVKFGLGYGHTELQLPQPYLQQFSTLFTTQSTKPKMDVSVLVNYLNHSRFSIKVPKFTLIAKADNAQFTWLGFSTDMTISHDLDRLEGDLLIDGLRFDKKDTSINLGKVSSEYDLNKQLGLYLGHASLSFPSLVVTQNNEMTFELKKLEARTESGVDDHLFNSHFQMSLDKIVADKKTYGPGVIKASIKNLDADVLAEINEKVNELPQDGSVQQQQILFSLMPQIPKLLSKGAKFEISEMRFVMPQGEVAGNLAIALPKEDLGNPFQLIQKTQGEGYLQIPATVLFEVMQQSEKQQILSQQPNLQQAISEQMSANQNAQSQSPDTNDASSNNAAQNAAVDGDATKQATTSNAVLDDAQIDKKAGQKAHEKLNALVKAGVLKRQGDSFIIKLKLENGQLTVNGQPFSMDMLR